MFLKYVVIDVRRNQIDKIEWLKVLGGGDSGMK